VRAARALLIAVVAALVLPSAASATVYTVTTTADHEDKFCDADCSLRDAVTAAGSADTINVPKGVYTLQASLGELLLVSDHIVGEGARAVFIDGAHETRLLRAADGSSSLTGVTLRNGNSTTAATTQFPGSGGAVFVQSGATLDIRDSAVTGNDASTGGGIAAAGTLLLIGSTVSGNDAATSRLTRGGGITAAGPLLMANSTVTGNSALDSTGGASSQGGGVWAGSTFLAQNTTIAGNVASSAGGVFLQAPAAGGTQTFTNTIVGSNSGGSCGGTGLTADSTHNNIGFDTRAGEIAIGRRGEDLQHVALVEHL